MGVSGLGDLIEDYVKGLRKLLTPAAIFAGSMAV